MSQKPLWSEDAEQAVLSAAFMDVPALAIARTKLSPESFYRSGHTLIFEALCAIADRGEVPDPITLSTQLAAVDALEKAGGKDYIGFLVDAVPTAANVEYHARIVRDLADRRGLVSIAEGMIENARDMKLPPDTVAQQVTSLLLPVAAHTKTRGFVPLSDLLVPVLTSIHSRRNSGGMAGTTWGYAALDEATGGIRGGEVVFICGTPGSAKSALVLNIGQRVADRTGRHVSIVSAEMPNMQVAERILNTTARIDSRAARKGELEQGEWDYLVKVGVSLKPLPLTIDDTGQPRIKDILAKCRAEKAKHPDLCLIIVDFVQLLKDSDDDNRSLELTEISYALKALAKELDVGIIVTCQVDAAAIEKREDKRPTLADLRWSQGMREAGDFICLIYNRQQYETAGPPELELSFRKARDLPVFTVRLRWIGEYMMVDDLHLRAA
jgi:replicative DNA helicase